MSEPLTLEQLHWFCSTDDERPIMNQPWTIDGFTYATDGAIAIRVPEIATVPARADAPKAADLFINAHNNHHGALYHSIPELPGPKKRLCRVCVGLGGVRYIPARYAFEDDDPEYQDLCPATLDASSNGVFACPDCDGVGKLDALQLIDVGPRRFNIKYLRLIAKLPLCGAAFFSRLTVESDPLHFLFADSGEGLLMPIRKEPSTDAFVVRVIQDPSCLRNQKENSPLPR